jgi:hypothetical protein
MLEKSLFCVCLLPISCLAIRNPPDIRELAEWQSPADVERRPSERTFLPIAGGGLMKSALVRPFRSEDGVPPIEFALILPVILPLSVGAIELTDAPSARRKVTQESIVSSDPIAQQRDVDATYASNAFTAVSMIMEPFSSDGVGSVM